MRVVFKWAACLAAGLAAAAAPAQATAEERLDSVLNELRPRMQVAGRVYEPRSLDALMREYRVPAVSIALIDDNRIVAARAYGMADPATGRAATPEMLFQAASISKPVAAMAALALVDDGLLDLDRPVNEQLTSWRIPDHSFETPVTLRHLLTHTGGLTVHGFPGYAVDAGLPTTVQILNGEEPANTDAVVVEQEPGSKWRYSGGGITAAELLMTEVTGESFPALVDRLVLRPLGMADSSYVQPLSPDRVGKAALAHLDDGAAVRGGYHVYPELAAAGLWTTPTDLARWTLALSAALNGADGGAIRPETAVAMLTPGLGGWGLGVQVGGEGEWLRFSHGGSNRGYKANLVAFPKKGQGLVVMTNGERGAHIIGAVLLAVGQMLGWPESEPRLISPAPLTREQRVELVGRYLVGEKQAYVVLRNDGLALIPPGDAPVEIIPQGEDVFVALDPQMRLQVMRGEAGEVTAIRAGGMLLSRDR